MPPDCITTEIGNRQKSVMKKAKRFVLNSKKQNKKYYVEKTTFFGRKKILEKNNVSQDEKCTYKAKKVKKTKKMRSITIKEYNDDDRISFFVPFLFYIVKKLNCRYK